MGAAVPPSRSKARRGGPDFQVEPGPPTAPGDSAPATPLLSICRAVLGGATIGVLVVVLALSFITMIYTGELSRLLERGVGVIITALSGSAQQVPRRCQKPARHMGSARRARGR